MVWLPGEWLRPAAIVHLVAGPAEEATTAPWRNADRRHNGHGRSPIQTGHSVVALDG
jgi:hypothetical protein